MAAACAAGIVPPGAGPTPGRTSAVDDDADDGGALTGLAYRALLRSAAGTMRDRMAEIRVRPAFRVAR